LDTFLNSPKVEVDYWYDLMATTGMTERVEHSRIRLQIQYTSDMDRDFLALPSTEVPELLCLQFLSHYLFFSQNNLAPNLLHIVVHSSSDLVGSAMEAFVEIEIGNLRKQSKVTIELSIITAINKVFYNIFG